MESVFDFLASVLNLFSLATNNTHNEENHRALRIVSLYVTLSLLGRAHMINSTCSSVNFFYCAMDVHLSSTGILLLANQLSVINDT